MGNMRKQMTMFLSWNHMVQQADITYRRSRLALLRTIHTVELCMMREVQKSINGAL